MRAELTDGTAREFRQPHMRGGAHSPLGADEIEAKFMDNTRYGGWDTARARRFVEVSYTIFTAARLDSVTEFRA